MFQLAVEESASLRSQSGALKAGRGKHRKYAPYAFTEQGIAMLSSVLTSERAVQVNIEIMRAFIRLRQTVSTHQDLAHKLVALENTYDRQFKVVLDAIRSLMKEPEPKRRKIGFTAKINEWGSRIFEGEMAMYPYLALRGPTYRENSHANHTRHPPSHKTACFQGSELPSPWLRFPIARSISGHRRPTTANVFFAVPCKPLSNDRWHWLCFHTQSCPFDRLR